MRGAVRASPGVAVMKHAIVCASLLAITPAAAAAPPERDCGLEPPEISALAPPVPTKPASSPVDAFAAPFVRRQSALVGPVTGALSGKTVYLSAGHGFAWTGSAWRTQRGNTNAIVEDLVSTEAVAQYLVPYLHAMGAYVVTVREPDLRTDGVIVDDDAATLEGAPMELGTETGFGMVALPITSDATAPFSAGSARTLAKGDGTGGLVYAPTLPSTGFYNVYVSFVQGPDRVADAHWVVRHSGGETHVRIDQRRHGSTWVLLGEFHFDVDAGPAVVVLDDSTGDGVISADAVRFGGTAGLHDRGGGTSGRPMYEHAARYYAQWSGAPSSVFAWLDADMDADVSTRSRFAAWEHEEGEDAVYLAWHSNAPNPRVGTSTYTYGSSAPPGPLSNFSGVAGSRELQDFVHGEIVDDLRAAWAPDWADEGRFTAYFGEVNPSHNPEMPAILVEVAYHDTPADADALRDPQFRRLVARAMAQGIARYFADADGTALVLPPEPPRAVVVRNDGDGGLAVSWRAPEAEPGSGDAADGWIVQVSTNGHGFDDGTEVAGTTHTITGLSDGDVRFVRVLGKNAGGRSLPSPVVGAAVAPSGSASVLVVGGFDRLDAGLLPTEDLSAYALDVVQRMWLRRMNDGSYATRHGLAIADAGFSFDGATDDAVELADVELADYGAIDWFAGEDSVGDQPLAPIVRDALTDYLDGGGRLMVSGAELGWALDLNGAPDEQAFFRERLHATYVGDDAETYDVVATTGPFEGLAPLSFADPEAYDPRFPDVIAPARDATITLAYPDGSAAAIAWGDDGERGILMGFPFETIAGADARRDAMAAALAFFEIVEAPGGGDTGDDADTGDDDDGTAGDASGSASANGDATASGSDGDGTGGPGADEGDDGCGCTTSSSRGGLALLVLAVAALRRRR